MADLVEAMGWNGGLTREGLLLGLIGSATSILLLCGIVVPTALSIPPELVQICVWALWLGWLGFAFPRNAKHDARAPCSLPYRRAFTREILLGISVAFSQMLRPAVYGAFASGIPLDGWHPVPTLLAVGLPVVVVGLALVGLGTSALGVARTLFVDEYRSTAQNVTMAGIYRILRHPLFLGGTVASVGLALTVGNPAGIALAMINVGVVPIYVLLEDRRCCTVLGKPYADYRATVGGMFPRRRLTISRSARSTQPPGSTPLIDERNLVTTR